MMQKYKKKYEERNEKKLYATCTRDARHENKKEIWLFVLET